jgi:tetratricopeptide (TPR) repeat protein
VTTPAALYQRAASCYEQAGYLARAADCWESARLPAAAARLFEQAGDLPSAARCHRRARQFPDAERCYLAVGQPEQAAAAWEEAGDLLRAAFVLAVSSRRIPQARWLAAEAATQPWPGSDRAAEARQLRLEAIIALCDARSSGDSASLADVLGVLEGTLPDLPPDDQWACVEFSVTLADAVGRHDLAARMLAALHRAGTPGAADRWRDWANQNLGGTTGIPDRSAAMALDGRLAPGAD